MTTALRELRELVAARRRLPPPAARRALRDAAGASLADVARACDVSKQAVAQWESGLYEPRGRNLLAYAEVLQIFRDVGAGQ